MKAIFAIAIPVIMSWHACAAAGNDIVMTVRGPVPASETGITLTHEHILVDFIGADSIHGDRWERGTVAERALPFLSRLKEYGCKTFVECTPEYLGRDPLLLRSLSEALDLDIITNTGLYGAGGNKFLPAYAFEESAEQLAGRWRCEWERGIGQTGIIPGFIKIGIEGETLSPVHRKLVDAAALTHLGTGMAIMSHTGAAAPAFEQLEILQRHGVSPEAFIWTHAQVESDLSLHVKAAGMGAWVAFDGLSEQNAEQYAELLCNMKENRVLDKVLLSHDAGWYDPGQSGGGPYCGYTALFEKLLPLLAEAGFTQEDIRMLLAVNPGRAFMIKVRTL